MTLTRVQSQLPDDLEQLVQRTIGCFLNVHSIIGPGFSEVVYVAACCVELETNLDPI